MTAKMKTRSKDLNVSDRVPRKLTLLELAAALGNVSKACEMSGFHRDTFYEVKRAFQTGGVQALLEKKRGPKGPHPNRISEEIETKILDFCLERPTYSAQRVANKLRLAGVNVSPRESATYGCGMTWRHATNACFAWKGKASTRRSC